MEKKKIKKGHVYNRGDLVCNTTCEKDASYNESAKLHRY